MRLWRIAGDTRTYRADDLSGGGAAKFPGRWNADGERVLYCAQTISLTLLETAAHIDDAGLPLNKYLVAVEIPDAPWAARTVLDLTHLGPTWDAIPAGQESIRHGSSWYQSKRSLVLCVPSVIVPEEFAVIVNADLPEAASLTARIERQIDYNRLFRR